MRNRYILLGVVLVSLCTLVTHAQVVFHFGSGGATYNSTTLGYEMSGVGTYYRSTSGGTVSDGTANCGGYTPSKATSSSVFIFQPAQAITKLTIAGTGTGSNRTFSSCSTATSLNGTYTPVSGATGTGTIQSGVCGTIEVTFPSAIPAGTYIRIVLSENVNITHLPLTLATQPPTVVTSGITTVTTTSAVVNAEVTNDGGSSVTERGVCWNTTGTPTVSDSKNNEGSGTGTYTSTLTGLTPGTVYYVRAYATNSAGTAYGSQVTFATLALEPTAQSTITFGAVTGNSIEVNFSGGDGARRIVLAKAGSAVDATPVDGVSYTANAVFGSGSQIGSGNYVVYDGTGTSVTVTNLLAGTTYHFAVFEYNVGSGNSQNYLTTSPGQNNQSTVAEPTLVAVPSSKDFGSVKIGQTSVWSYALSGTYLIPASGTITVTAPAGYGVSLSSGGTYTSSLEVPYESGSVTATVYVQFAPSAMNTYSGNITNAGGGAPTVNVAVTGVGTLYEIGDYACVASGDWGTLSTWKRWDGSGWNTTASAQPTQNDNVWILGGYTVTLETSSKTCKNLYVINGTLRSGSLVNSPRYIGIYGNEVRVEENGVLGSAQMGDNANGLSLDIFSNNVTFTGSGGLVSISRLRTNTANTVVTIDRDMTLNYHGTGNAGNAFAYYVNSTTADNGVLTINAGKTLTFAPWACLACSSRSHSTMGVNHMINVYGTLTFLPGPPDPDTNTTVNGWPGHDSYLSMGVASGKTFTLNIGSTGVVNVVELYPNGTKSDNTPGTGSLSVINIEAGGVLNVGKIADFRNSAQTVVGGGTFALADGAILRIGSAGGVDGHLQCSGKQLSQQGEYWYEGTQAQVVGANLPSTVKKLVVNNASGVTLSQNVVVSDTLKLTSGIVTTDANVLRAQAVLRGAGHVDGILAKPVPEGTNIQQTYEIGTGNNYLPVTMNFNNVSTSGVVSVRTIAREHPQATGAGIDTAKSVNRYWILDGTSLAFDSATITLSYTAEDIDQSSTLSNFILACITPTVVEKLPVSTITAASAEATIKTLGTLLLGEPIQQIPQYTISASVVGNGTITPSGEVVVTQGGTVTFTFAAQIGSRLDSVLVDGVKVDSTESYTFLDVTANHTIVVYFSPMFYTITVQSLGKGSVEPHGDVRVQHGESIRFTFVPQSGSRLDSVLVDGVKVDSTTGYTFTNVTANHSLVVYFSEITYTIVATAHGNGTVTPSGTLSIKHGESIRFTFSSYAGNRLDSVIVDGSKVDSTGGYTFTNVTGNHTIDVYFSEIPTTVLATGTVPRETRIYGNYPNPFNPSTTIRFTVAKSERVVVSVYNVLGQRVAELFNGNAEAGKYYDVVFDALSLPSGVYVVTLETLGTKSVQKIVLMK